MSLIESYFNITKEYSEKYGEKTAVLMMVGSFYEIYGEKTGVNSDSNSNNENIFKVIASNSFEDTMKKGINGIKNT